MKTKNLNRHCQFVIKVCTVMTFLMTLMVFPKGAWSGCVVPTVKTPADQCDKYVVCVGTPVTLCFEPSGGDTFSCGDPEGSWDVNYLPYLAGDLVGPYCPSNYCTTITRGYPGGETHIVAAWVAYNDCDGTWCGSNSWKSVTITNVAVYSLGADQGQNWGGGTTVVDWASSGVVTVTAQPDGVPKSEVPSCWNLTGGVGNDPCVRTLPKNQPGIFPFIATAGTSSRTCVVVIAKCQFRAFARIPSSDSHWGHAWWMLTLEPDEAKVLIDPDPAVQAYVNQQVGYYNTISTSCWGPGEVETGPQGAPDCSQTWLVGFWDLYYGVEASSRIKQGPNQDPSWLTYDCLLNNCVTALESIAASSGVTLPCAATLPLELCTYCLGD